MAASMCAAARAVALTAAAPKAARGKANGRMSSSSDTVARRPARAARLVANVATEAAVAAWLDQMGYGGVTHFDRISASDALMGVEPESDTMMVAARVAVPRAPRSIPTSSGTAPRSWSRARDTARRWSSTGPTCRSSSTLPAVIASRSRLRVA